MIKTKRMSRDKAKEVVLKLVGEHSRPVLIGEASVRLKTWSLRETEDLIWEMLDEGTILAVGGSIYSGFVSS